MITKTLDECLWCRDIGDPLFLVNDVIKAHIIDEVFSGDGGLLSLKVVNELKQSKIILPSTPKGCAANRIHI